MQRRDFCKYLASTAALKPIRGFGESAQDSRPGAPDGFNRYTKDYAQFCALPPEKRVFYRLSGDRIVEAKPDDAAGKPSAGASQARCPSRAEAGTACPWSRRSRISRERARTNLRGIRCSSTTRRNVPRREVRYLGPLEPAVRARSRRLVTPRTCYVEDQPQYKYHLEHYGPPRASATRTSARSGRC